MSNHMELSSIDELTLMVCCTDKVALKVGGARQERPLDVQCHDMFIVVRIKIMSYVLLVYA